MNRKKTSRFQECFKVPVEKTEVERDAISDITHYDSCLDSIGVSFLHRQLLMCFGMRSQKRDKL